MMSKKTAGFILLLIVQASLFCQELKKECEIRLQLTSESALSSITDLEVDDQGRLIIADGWKLRRVFVFNAAGDFLRQLGSIGQGPGEYNTPLSLEINSKNEILVADYLGNKIHVFNNQYVFRRAILCRPRIRYFLHLNSEDEIFFFDGSSFRKTISSLDTIFKFTKAGEFEKSFAPLTEKIIQLEFSAIYDGMDIDFNDDVYHMHPLEYRIRKYNKNGEAVLEFNVPKRIQKIEKGENLNGPFCTDRFLLVQRNQFVDIYDFSSQLLKESVLLHQKILRTKKNSVYTEEEPKTDANPIIVVYSIE